MLPNNIWRAIVDVRTERRYCKSKEFETQIMGIYMKKVKEI